MTAYDLRQVARAVRRHRAPGRTKAELRDERQWLDELADRLEQLADEADAS